MENFLQYFVSYFVHSIMTKNQDFTISHTKKLCFLKTNKHGPGG